jgi:hypothetical protein
MTFPGVPDDEPDEVRLGGILLRVRTLPCVSWKKLNTIEGFEYCCISEESLS